MSCSASVSGYPRQCCHYLTADVSIVLVSLLLFLLHPVLFLLPIIGSCQFLDQVDSLSVHKIGTDPSQTFLVHDHLPLTALVSYGRNGVQGV